MFLAAQRRLIGPTAAAIRCDQCMSMGVGSEEELVAEGWAIEELRRSPHLCPDCALICWQPGAVERARAQSVDANAP
jgi:hypothetical protein